MKDYIASRKGKAIKEWRFFDLDLHITNPVFIIHQYSNYTYRRFVYDNVTKRYRGEIAKRKELNNHIKNNTFVGGTYLNGMPVVEYVLKHSN